MDLQVKLVDDGHAHDLQVARGPKLPAWARVQEPGLRHDVRAGRVHLQQAAGDRRRHSQDHAAFTKLLNTKADKFKGKVTTYDVEKSGVGFMFVMQDAKYFPA